MMILLIPDDAVSAVFNKVAELKRVVELQRTTVYTV